MGYIGDTGLAYLWGKIKLLISDKANTSDLAEVATSGSYNDLANKPTIPTSLSSLTSDSTHRVVTDTEKSTWNNKSNVSMSVSGEKLEITIN